MLFRYRIVSLLCVMLMALSLMGVPADAKPSSDRRSDPWPTGNEWPENLEGPFDYTTQPLEIDSFDGVKLRGYLFLPKVPDGVDLPAILWSSPYHGTLDPAADESNETAVLPLSENNEDLPNSVAFRVPKMMLVKSGYAFAAVSVRGTGQSGGCMTQMGEPEQKDQKILVDWLAAQPWSNGRVGAIGQSYDGATAMEAATQAPDALKAVVATEAPIDWSSNVFFTPEGSAAPLILPAQHAANHGAYDGTTIPRYTDDPTKNVDPLARFLDVVNGSEETGSSPGSSLVERACPDVARHLMTGVNDGVADERDASFYLERRFFDDLPKVSAAVLVGQGFRDTTVYPWASPATAWDLIRSPKSLILGQWGHCTPRNLMNEDWDARVLEWFDFWLKGLGPVPSGVGRVDYEINTDADSSACLPTYVKDNDLWQTTTSWPPRESRQEVLYLRNSRLDGEAGTDEPATFTASPSSSPTDALCATRDDAIVFTSEPLGEDTAVTGSPIAYLRVSSDSDRGIVMVSLWDLGTTFDCSGDTSAARPLLVGAMDLRFYRGNFSAAPFPDGPVNVRVTFNDLAEMLPAGHRIAVVLSGPTASDPAGMPFAGVCSPVPACAPRITLEAGRPKTASQLMLPVTIGTTDGRKPMADYPSRPDFPQ